MAVLDARSRQRGARRVRAPAAVDNHIRTPRMTLFGGAQPPGRCHSFTKASVDMNLYATMASGAETPASSSLADRLAEWHDAMVAHERRLRGARRDDECDDECPHVEARALWAEALRVFGERAHELVFLRSRAAGRP
jgi:hypothetical protein